MSSVTRESPRILDIGGTVVKQIRVLLANANDDFLEVASEWLMEEPIVLIVGIARSGQQAIDQATSLRPDVVLMDAGLRSISGFEAMRRIKANADAPAVVLTSVHDSRAIREEAATAGADGFISGADMFETLMPLLYELVKSDFRSKTLDPLTGALSNPQGGGNNTEGEPYE